MVERLPQDVHLLPTKWVSSRYTIFCVSTCPTSGASVFPYARMWCPGNRRHAVSMGAGMHSHPTMTDTIDRGGGDVEVPMTVPAAQRSISPVLLFLMSTGRRMRHRALDRLLTLFFFPSVCPPAAPFLFWFACRPIPATSFTVAVAARKSPVFFFFFFFESICRGCVGNARSVSAVWVRHEEFRDRAGRVSGLSETLGRPDDY